MASRFGLGAETGVDLPGERRGLIPTREWKLATRGTPWQMGETLVSAIGQGFILTTPLQLAVMTARLVNGGKAVAPRIEASDGPIAPAADLAIDGRHLERVREAMSEVVNGERGTARGIRGGETDIGIAGKTGTAQVKRITMAERAAGLHKSENRPWRHRDHALFVGYGPVEAPRYAVAVVVEHGGGGSSMAAPIAADVLREALRIDPLAPPVGPTAALDGSTRSE